MTRAVASVPSGRNWGLVMLAVTIVPWFSRSGSTSLIRPASLPLIRTAWPIRSGGASAGTSTSIWYLLWKGGPVVETKAT